MQDGQCHKRPENEEVPPTEILGDFKRMGTKTVHRKMYRVGQEERRKDN